MGCSVPVGTMTTGPSPRCADGWAEQGLLESGSRAARMARALPGSSPGRLRARRRRAKRAKSAARTASLDAARRELPDPARPAGQDVQSAVDVDDLDQLGGAELVKQVRRAERGLARGVRRRGTAARWRAPPSPAAAAPAASDVLCLPWLRASSRSLVTVRSAARLALSSASASGRTAGTARAVARQRSLQVSRSRGRRCLRGVALRERGQLGAVHGGLRPEFGGAEGEPVLVQDLQPPAAGGQHPARTVRGLGPQRLAEPAADP